MGNNLESFPRLVQLIISMVFTGLIAAIYELGGGLGNIISIINSPTYPLLHVVRVRF